MSSNPEYIFSPRVRFHYKEKLEIQKKAEEEKKTKQKNSFEVPQLAPKIEKPTQLCIIL